MVKECIFNANPSSCWFPRFPLLCPSRLYVQLSPPHYCQPGKGWNAKGALSAMLVRFGWVRSVYLVGLKLGPSQLCTLQKEEMDWKARGVVAGLPFFLSALLVRFGGVGEFYLGGLDIMSFAALIEDSSKR